MNYYEKIRAIRNEKFPPEMEFGVSADYMDSGDFRANWCSVESKDVIIASASQWSYSDEIINIIDSSGDTHQVNKYSLTTLGKPVSLNDVLRLISGESYTETIYDELRFYYRSSDIEVEDFFMSIDLSKEIKNQDESVLEKIYNLIK